MMRSLLTGLGLGPASKEGGDPDDARAAQAVARAQSRRAHEAESALQAVRERLDALETELYVARSEAQRAAVRVEELEARLAARDPPGEGG